MSPRRFARLRSPKVVAVALAIVGMAGATSVYFAGKAVRANDRADFAAWERSAAPALDAALAVHRAVPAVAAAMRSSTPRRTESTLTGFRRDLERARNRVLAAPIPSIVRPAAEAYLEGIARTLEGVSALQDIVNGTGARAERIGAYERAQRIADRRFARAAALREQVRARLKG